MNPQPSQFACRYFPLVAAIKYHSCGKGNERDFDEQFGI